MQFNINRKFFSMNIKTTHFDLRLLSFEMFLLLLLEQKKMKHKTDFQNEIFISNRISLVKKVILFSNWKVFCCCYTLQI